MRSLCGRMPIRSHTVGVLRNSCEKALDRLRLYKTEVHPSSVHFLFQSPERRTIFGVRENTVRLSVGIEQTEKILGDLALALEKV